MSRHRGRKGAAELAVVPISAVQRPEPPAEFDERETEIWRQTVGGMRADWFRVETHPLLRGYCREAALADFLGAALRTTPMSDKGFAKLQGMHSRATKTMLTLARSLRITPQANRMSARDGRDPTGGRPKPWEIRG